MASWLPKRSPRNDDGIQIDYTENNAKKQISKKPRYVLGRDNRYDRRRDTERDKGGDSVYDTGHHRGCDMERDNERDKGCDNGRDNRRDGERYIAKVIQYRIDNPIGLTGPVPKTGELTKPCRFDSCSIR